MSNDLEARLRGALRRGDPPDGFAERVLARVEPPRRRWVRPLWAGAAVAAMLLAMAGYRQVQEQRRAEEAREKAMVALHITAEKLNKVRVKLERRNP